MSIEAMKQALEALDAYSWEQVDAARTALKQAIAEAEKQEPVAELVKLMAEDGVTGVLIEVHRGPLSKSIRTWGECDCPTSTDNDVTIEVRPIHAIDMSEKHVQESDKNRHEPYNPMERNADYERGFIDGRADQMKSSVDKAVNRMAQREWVGLTDEDIYKVIEENIPPQLNTLFDMAKWVGEVIEAKLKEKNA
jgi:hypothetical protein